MRETPGIFGFPGREEDMKSWRRTLTGLLAFLLIMLLGFLVWTNISYYKQSVDDIKRQNTHTAELWESSVETRLSMLCEHLYELFLTIYNNTELGTGTAMMQYSAKKKCLDMMSDKLRVSEDSACFYLVDTESSLRLFYAGNSVTNLSKSNLKQYFYTTEFDAPVGLSDKSWSIEVIGDELYFVKIISLGKYMVGTASNLSRYDILESYNIVGSAPSCYLSVGGELYSLSTTPESPTVTLDAFGNAVGSGISVITSQAALETCNAQIILAARQSVFQNGNGGAAMLCGASILCVLLFFVLLFVMQRMIVHPTSVILKANRELSGRNADYRITERANSQEFEELFKSFNDMADSLQKMRIEAYDRQIRAQRDELKLLRAQIRPHFYLNAITTVSNMTYQNRNDDIRNYLAELAKYMRYMLNAQNRWVRIAEEIGQIKSYLEMQKIKFPGSVDAYIGCAEAVADTRVPYLLLFTAVENTFKHAMNLYEPLWLVVQCESYQENGFCGCRMIVEDNGKGFPPEVLDMFSAQNSETLPSAKDHLGLTNIRRTLQLIYHRNDLLRLSNAKTGGAHVEIWIPEENDEATDL